MATGRITFNFNGGPSRTEKWDRRYIDLMKLVGGWSKDPSTKVGAVIVRPDRTVASIGYNGFPRGMSDDAALYADREIKYSRIVHGEINAILNAHGPVDGCTLYVPFPPCDRCAVQVIQAGIVRVVYEEPTEDIKSRWGEAFVKTAAIFEDAGVEVVELAPEPKDAAPPIPMTNAKLRRAGEGLLIHVTMPTRDGKLVAADSFLLDGMLLEAMGVIGQTDQDRLDLVSRVCRRAAVEAQTLPKVRIAARQEATCKGSINLGSGCRKCRKCREEMNS